jgi:hypothetical protein
MKQLYKAIVDNFIPHCYGQLGEDAIIANHLAWMGLDPNAKGMYLDIGCYHPTRGSNTYKFYKNKAHGFVFDVGLGKQRLWKMIRARDYFINKAVVPEDFIGSSIDFALSSSFGSQTDSIVETTNLPLQTRKVSVIKPSQITSLVLSSQMWLNSPWRLISIDLEGIDFPVLSGLDIHKLNANVIAVECLLPATVSPQNKFEWIVNDCPTYHLMAKYNYSLMSVSGPTMIYGNF